MGLEYIQKTQIPAAICQFLTSIHLFKFASNKLPQLFHCHVLDVQNQNPSC